MDVCKCQTPVLTIALDIGTTNSCAVARGEIHCHLHQRFETLGPSRISKHPTVLTPANDGGFAYVDGFTHLNNVDAFRYFKLFMAEPGDLQAFRRRLRNANHIIEALERVEERDHLKMFVDYAKGFYTVAKGRLNLWHGPEVPIRLVLTVPAIFGDTPQAIDRLTRVKEALQEHAGQQVLVEQMYEHEAAVRGVLFEDPKFLETQVRAGAEVMVADVGGATIDAAVYSLKDLTTINIPQWDCAVKGALLLDAAFFKKLQRKFFLADAEAAQIALRPDIDPEILAQWDLVKRTFSPDAVDSKRWVFYDSRRHLEATFTKSEITHLFNGFALKVARQLSDWWDDFYEDDSKPEVVYITGGISQSIAFQQAVRSAFKKMDRNLKELRINVVFGSTTRRCDGAAWHVVGLGGTLGDKSVQDLYCHATNMPPT